MKHALYLLFVLLLVAACHKTPNYAVVDVDESIVVEFERFERDFYALKEVGVEQGKWDLQKNYGTYFKIYNMGVIKIGDVDAPGYDQYANRFLNDEVFLEVYDTVQSHFANMQRYESALTEVFQRYNSFFPELPLPAFYTHISGFNEPLVVADSLLSVSLENYLGQDHVFYPRLGTYTYLLPTKNPERLVADCMRAWLIAEFQTGEVSKNLLDAIIDEGKLLFIHEQLMPDEPLSHLIGLTDENYKWCEANEMNLWKYMMEHQHLFSSSQTVIAKYTQNGPFFNFLGSGTSPMVGRYVGWQIVREYMKNNTGVTLLGLVDETNAQKILQNSGYRP